VFCISVQSKQLQELMKCLVLLLLCLKIVRVAQQDAERAKYVVIGAIQEKETIITKARGEAESAELIGMAVNKNPGFMKLRRIDAARDIADIVAKSGNKVYLNADSLLLNLLGDAGDDKFENSVKKRSGYFRK
jgi:regulator of protease activity HflC (stomatin/prohibitin superfamily)